MKTVYFTGVLLMGFLLIGVTFSTGGVAAQEDTTFNVTNEATSAYNIDGQSNPDLNLTPGTTYTFEIDATGHPFYLRYGNGTVYKNVTVTNPYNGENKTENGTLTVTIPEGFGENLYYQCNVHSDMTGQAYAAPQQAMSSPTASPTAANVSSGGSNGNTPIYDLAVLAVLFTLVAGGGLYLQRGGGGEVGYR